MRHSIISPSRGFTLIELLTVIAIIAMLAAISAFSLPRIRERGKIVATEATMAQVRNSLASYFVDHNSFPPGYGYKWQEALSGNDVQDYVLKPYFSDMKQDAREDYLDPWPATHDTNDNNQIDLLEFMPIPQTVLGVTTYPNTRFLPDGPFTPELDQNVNRQLGSERPFIYIPVYKDDAEKVRKYYYNVNSPSEDRLYARGWDYSNARLGSIQHPPPRYDAYVIISAGPNLNTFGILPQLTGVEQPGHEYHITGLRAYYLATRNLNDDGFLDFDWRARKNEAQGQPGSYTSIPVPNVHLLPDGSAGYGPMIFKYE